MLNDCVGLKTNAANLTADYNGDDDSAKLCPACRYPPSVAGVELPRLDHVNLPNCNFPPSLIDSRGLPSKVRVGGVGGGIDTAASEMTLANRFMQFVENPLYLALVCTLGFLLIAVVCAILAVVSRHAASYYTNEGRRKKAAKAELATATGDESEGLFPLKLAKEDNHRDQIVKVGRKQLQLKLDEGEKKPLNSKNNNGKAKKDDSSSIRANASISVTSRGVHCPGTTTPIYPLSIEQQERSLC